VKKTAESSPPPDQTIPSTNRWVPAPIHTCIYIVTLLWKCARQSRIDRHVFMLTVISPSAADYGMCSKRTLDSYKKLASKNEAHVYNWGLESYCPLINMYILPIFSHYDGSWDYIVSKSICEAGWLKSSLKACFLKQHVRCLLLLLMSNV